MDEIEQSRDGYYTLVSNVIPSFKMDDYSIIFKRFGQVQNIRQYQNFIFIRYKDKSEAIRCLNDLKNSKFNVRVAENKPMKDPENRPIDQISNTNTYKTKTDKVVSNLNDHLNNGIKNKSNEHLRNEPESRLSVTSESKNDLLVLGKRNDANTHLFIANLSEKTTRKDLWELLKEYIIINLSNFYTTLPHQSVRVKYVVVTMPMKEAIQAMINLNNKDFMGNCLMVMEVRTMYFQAISPLSVKEDKSLLPPTLEEMLSQYRCSSSLSSSTSSSKNRTLNQKFKKNVK